MCNNLQCPNYFCASCPCDNNGGNGCFGCLLYILAILAIVYVLNPC